MKKQAVLALGLVLLVGAAILWVRLDRFDSTATEGVGMDSTSIAGDGERPPAVERPGEVPPDLKTWIEATLWRNGLLESHRDSFLTTEAYGRTRLWVDSTGIKPVWTVDLVGLDVAVLGSDPSSGERPADHGYEVRLRVGGTRLCADADRRIEHAGWSLQGDGSLRCGPDDGRKLVHDWFFGRFGRDPGASELSMDGEKVVLDISCRGKDAVGALGRLRSVEFSRLKLSGCSLTGPDALLLADLSVGRMELVDLETTILPFARSRVSERLSVRGGSVRWVDPPLVCPKGRKDCEFAERVLTPGLSMELRGVPLCDPFSTANLRQYGVVLDDLRCQDIPLSMIERRDSLEARWDRLVGGNVRKLVLEPHETIPLDLRPTFPNMDQTWEMVIETNISDECNSGSYPKEYNPSSTFGTRERIQDSYFEGTAIQIAYKGRTIRAGMDREAVIQIMGRPTVDRDGFLAWTVAGSCGEELANLRAHFDAQGKLDAWIDHVEPECGGC